MMSLLILVLFLLAFVAMAVAVVLGHTPDSRRRDFSVGALLEPGGRRR